MKKMMMMMNADRRMRGDALLYSVSAIFVCLLLTQEVYSQVNCARKIDLAFLVDNSGSIQDRNPANKSWDNWSLMKSFIVTMIQNSQIGYDRTRIAVVTFGNYAETRFSFSAFTDAASIISAVNQLQPGQGETNLQAGLNMLRTTTFTTDQGSREDYPHIAVVMTDGIANKFTENTIPEANKCYDAGILIFTIGITDTIDEAQLKAVSSPPREKGKNYWTTPDFTQLNTILASVQNATCDPPKQCTEDYVIMDIAIAIDIPQDQSDWTKEKTFIKKLITDYLKVGVSEVRVAVVTFTARSANVVFNLSRYVEESEVKIAIDQIQYVASGNADVTYAINTLSQSIFNSGNRTGGRSVAVLLMDNALVNINSAVNASKQLQSVGVRVVAIDITGSIGLNTLRSISSKPGDVIVAAGYTFLSTKNDQLGTIICSNNPPPQCPMVADIILILDQSTSIIGSPGGSANWDTYAIGFALSISQAFPISPNETRMGVIKFSTSAAPAIYLNAASSNDQMETLIKALQIDGGDTNIAEALRVTRQEMYSPSRGARPNVPHLSILVTDGKANVDAQRTLSEANMTKAAGIELFAVGITSSVDATQLQSICTAPWESHYFYVDDYSKLATIIQDLIAKSCITTTTQSTTPTTTTTTSTTARTTTPTTTTQTTTTPTTSAATPTTTTTTPTTSTTTPTTTTTTPTTSATTPTTTTTTPTASTTTPTTTTTTPTTTTPTTTTPTTITPTTTTPTTTTPTTTTPTTTTPTATTPTTSTTTPTTTTNTPTTTTTTPTTTTTTPTTTTTTPTTTTTTPTTITSTPTTTTTTTTTTTPTTAAMNPTTRGSALSDQLPGRTSISTPRSWNRGEYCSTSADIAFVIDKTSNMNYDSYTNLLLKLATYVATNYRTGVEIRVALVTFSESPTVEFYFNKYTTVGDIAAAIAQASYGGLRANLADALRVVRTDVFSSANGHRTADTNVASVAVIITDNVSTNQTAALIEAQRARDAGIHVITIGIGSYINEYELSMVASYPFSRNMVITNTVRTLQNDTFKELVLDLVCNRNGSCGDKSPALCQPYGTCNAGFNQITCTCSSSGKTGPYCSNNCLTASDVIFAVDISRSIGMTNFQNLVNFVSSIVQNLRLDDGVSIDPMVSQVGLFTFGSTPQLHFHLNRYRDKQSLLHAINLPYKADNSADLAQAISYARDVMFTAENGDRTDFPNELVLLTDRSSTNSTASWLESIKARDQGINVMAIGVGANVNVAELVSVASAPDSSNVLLLPDINSLNDEVVVNNVSANLCKNVDRCSQPMMPACENGATCKNTMGGYSCGPCLTGFTGTRCEQRCTGKIDVVFMLDSAGTVHFERFQNLTNFAISIVDQMDIGPTQTRVGLVYWGGEGYAGFLLNQYTNKQDVMQAIRNTPYLGNKTNTASAFRSLRRSIFVEDNGDRRDAENFVIFVANGDSTVDQSLTIAEAIQSRLNGNHMITVGVEPQMQKSLELEAITSFPRDFNSFYASSFRTLPNVTAGVIAAMCNSTNLCLSSACQNGGSCVSGYGQYKCECLPRFAGINCQRRCTRQMDVVFILDVSGSVEDDYRLTMNFARIVVAGLDIESGAVRVGAVAFATSINGQFYLNQNIGRQIAVIDSLDFKYIGGTTNTALALTTVKNSHFTGSRGDRPGVDNIVVLVSDGYSNVDEDQTIPLSDQLKNSGVIIYVVAIGDNTQMSELVDIISDVDDLVTLTSSSQINDAADQLLDKLCPNQ